MTEVLLTEDFLEAAIELRYVMTEIDKLQAQAERCKEILAKHLVIGDTGVDANGQALVKVQKGAAMFKPELALKYVPPTLLEKIMTPVPDRERAKQHLTESIYELCCQNNKPSIKVI